ncbi:MAG: hypothetical protein IKS40_04850 [Treponema sp.]|nr:hypothetical protein [Treponema sp.]
MKRKLMATLVALSVAFSLCVTGCKNDDDSNTVEISDAQLELDSVAFNVLRGLCALKTDDDARNSAEDKGNGIEDLPPNWQSATYELDQALVADPSQDGAYFIACSCADDAKEFFSNLTGESVTESSCSWNMTGFGSLYFELSPTAEDENTKLFATLDASIGVLPGLQSIKFVPASVLPEGNNKFSGTPFYHAGDIIMRKKDSSYWMCVRPAAGPAKKDYSYWICLNPSVAGVVQTVEKSYTINGQQKRGIYGNKLMSEKVAKATIHTLHMLSLAWWTGSGNGRQTAQAMTFKLIEPDRLAAKYDSQEARSPGYFRNMDLVQDDAKSNQTFYVAYGSPKKDGKRTLKGNRADSSFSIVQPIMLASITKDNDKKIREYIDTHFYGSDKKTTTCYSLTDTYDEKYKNAHLTFFSQGVLTETYDVRKYYQKCTAEASMIGWKDVNAAYNDKSAIGVRATVGGHVIISPELKIKDHGTAATGYTSIFSAKDLAEGVSATDYWESLKAANTQRYVNGKQVNMAKQISE